ncbi:MAG TPA: pyridoxal-phosphate dependent enzyme [Thermomicrobiales bacterium]|nr:pyridoxal-phosphate dependent enzyme [Thermomicrobiales bacterium]
MPRTVSAPSPADLATAREIVRQHLAPTPLLRASVEGRDAWLKLETFQPTGAFKVRGALAGLTTVRDAGHIVTASAGNHALGVAWASRRLGVPATIVVAETASPVKIEKLRALGADLVLHGDSYDEAEAHALALAAAGGHYLSPYNDTHVIAGQATVLDELLGQLPDDGAPLTLVVPVGGGGLLAGIALRAAGIQDRDIRLIGVEAAESRAVSSGVAAGRTVEIPVGETIADGLAGNVEAGSVTVDILRERGVRFVAAEEAAIRAGVRWLMTEHGLVAEGSAAATIAAIRSGLAGADEGHLAGIITGRNITWPLLREIMDEDAR